MPDYRFDGKVIRLNQRDFERWEAAFPSLDLTSELAMLDAWYHANEIADWYVRCAAALRKRHDKLVKGRASRGVDEDKRLDSMAWHVKKLIRTPSCEITRRDLAKLIETGRITEEEARRW